MTATALTSTVRPQTSTRDLRPLIGFEGWKLLRHPLFLAFAALSALFTLIWLGESANDSTNTWYSMLGGSPVEFIPFAAGVLVAANMAKYRSRHDGTDELYGSMPVTAASRVAANLTSVAWAVVVSMVLVAIGVVISQAWDGLPVALDTTSPTEWEDYPIGVGEPTNVTPSLAELAQVPLAVALFGLIGVALAVWVRSRLILVLLPVLIMVHLMIVAWGLEVAWRWFLPFANSDQAVGFVQTDPSNGYSVVQGFNVAAMGWHDLYLVGAGAVVAALALARYRRDRTVLGLFIGGAVLATVGGVMQLAVYTPSL